MKAPSSSARVLTQVRIGGGVYVFLFQLLHDTHGKPAMHAISRLLKAFFFIFEQTQYTVEDFQTTLAPDYSQ